MMNEKKKNPAVQIWYVAYPFLFYYAVSIIVMSLCTMIMGDSQAHFVARQLVTTIVTIPFMMPFYKQDRAFAGREEIHDWFTRERLCVIGASVLIVACISISLNNIISMTPLVTASVGYQEANANFYGSTLVLELISSALMTPILEELVFRGILFTRLKSMIPKIPAIIGHITANLIAVLRTETGILNRTMDKSAFAWVISVVLLVVGVGALIVLVKKNKQ